jgi:hypothetical protein
LTGKNGSPYTSAYRKYCRITKRTARRSHPVRRHTFIAGSIISSAWDLFQFSLPVSGDSVGQSASVIGPVHRMERAGAEEQTVFYARFSHGKAREMFSLSNSAEVKK